VWLLVFDPVILLKPSQATTRLFSHLLHAAPLTVGFALSRPLCSMEGQRRFKFGAAALAQFAMTHRDEVRFACTSALPLLLLTAAAQHTVRMTHPHSSRLAPN
jgi:hypothetical protein